MFDQIESSLAHWIFEIFGSKYAWIYGPSYVISDEIINYLCLFVLTVISCLNLFFFKFSYLPETLHKDNPLAFISINISSIVNQFLLAINLYIEVLELFGLTYTYRFFPGVHLYF